MQKYFQLFILVGGFCVFFQKAEVYLSLPHYEYLNKLCHLAPFR